MIYIDDPVERGAYVFEQLEIVFLAIQRLYHRARFEVSVVYPNADGTSLVIKGSPGITAGMQNGFNSKTLQKNVLKAVEEWGKDVKVFDRVTTGQDHSLRILYPRPPLPVIPKEVYKDAGKRFAILLRYIRKYFKYVAQTSLASSVRPFKRGFPWERWAGDSEMTLVGFPAAFKRTLNPRTWNRKQLLILFNLCAKDAIGPLLPAGVSIDEVQRSRLPPTIAQAKESSASPNSTVSTPSCPSPSSQSQDPVSSTPTKSSTAQSTPYPTPEEKRRPMSISNLITDIPKPNFQSAVQEKLLQLVNEQNGVQIGDEGVDQGAPGEAPIQRAPDSPGFGLNCDVKLCPGTLHGKCESFGCCCGAYYCEAHWEDAEEHDFVYAVFYYLTSV